MIHQLQSVILKEKLTAKASSFAEIKSSAMQYLMCLEGMAMVGSHTQYQAWGTLCEFNSLLLCAPSCPARYARREGLYSQGLNQWLEKQGQVIAHVSATCPVYVYFPMSACLLLQFFLHVLYVDMLACVLSTCILVNLCVY